LSLPKEVKRRIKALKKLQNEIIHIESEFYKEVNALELKYAPKYSELFEKRKEILIAAREPTDEDCDWASEEEDDEDKDEDAKLAGELKDKVTLEGTKEAGGDSEEKKQEFVKGIPSFWLTIFKNVEMLSEMVQEHDEPILTHLQDIKVVIHEKDPVGFTLEFYFEPNEYFTDTVLTKRYEMRYDPDSQDPFSYEGPEIIKCSGCTINWNKGKNVTVKQIKKKQKHKGRGLTRTVTKQVQADSFFNFFNPPAVPDGSESEMDKETFWHI
uniref:Uncharacterized protein n=1 Tax=Biomphalaria glabrata TaxID=6526 RepID=A0A2C9KDK7_BIOGL